MRTQSSGITGEGGGEGMKEGRGWRKRGDGGGEGVEEERGWRRRGDGG